MTEKRDDSRDLARKILATLELLKSVLPSGYTSAQVGEMKLAERGLDDCMNHLKGYISLREQMP